MLYIKHILLCFDIYMSYINIYTLIIYKLYTHTHIHTYEFKRECDHRMKKKVFTSV